LYYFIFIFQFSLPIFTQFRITDEDKNKNQMYLEEREREQIKFTTTSLSDYIAKLGLEIKLRINPIEWIPRLAQLTLKTNQFNLTTTRYTEDQMKQFMNIGRVYAADVSDKFGNYGITIVSIIKYSKDQANLDSFLMSCRVMGRGIEKVFFQFICQDLANLGVTSLSARFIPTAKNAPAKEFLASMGMQEIGRDNEGGIRYNMSIQVGYPADESKSPITIILQ
jgi:FkbH-like protein